jgi:hypothetical protein
VSCDPTGAAPVATEFNRYPPSSGTPIGGFFPITKVNYFRAQPRAIAANGSRVFFDSGEPLVPQDVNGWLDVYEWERNGTGSCHQPSGCTYLLSGGTRSESSYLLGASSTGDDAFVITSGQLVAPDHNETFDVYDARAGGASPSPEAALCSGEGCRGPAGSPPSSPSLPGSSLFSGSPDPSPVKCRTGQGRKHGKCVKKKAKKNRHHGKSKKRHSSSNRWTAR